MDKEKIQKGIVTTDYLIRTFGNDKQLEKYSTTGTLTKYVINNIFENAKKYCQIEKHGDNYLIKRIYEYPLPAKVELMEKSLYKNIIPLILYHVIEDAEKGRSMELTVGRWARTLAMVNQNYKIGRNYQNEIAEDIRIDYEYILQFYDKADDYISYYIKRSLDMLAEARLVKWTEIYYVVTEYIDEKAGSPEVTYRQEFHEATNEDFAYIAKCEGIADKATNIKTISERYYSKKAFIWERIYKNELMKRNISFVYKSYRIASVQLDACKHLLKHFGACKQSTLEKRLSREFAELVTENADKRLKKDMSKYMIKIRQNHIIYNKLCNMLILPTDKSLQDFISIDLELENKETIEEKSKWNSTNSKNQ